MLQYAEQFGIPVSELRFIGGGKQMEEHLTCDENGLSRECTLNAVLRTREEEQADGQEAEGTGIFETMQIFVRGRREQTRI
jgi:hypothetical protein